MANILAKLFEYYHKTVADLSEETGISIDTLEHYKNHPTAHIPKEHFSLIAKYFKVDERVVRGFKVKVTGTVPDEVEEEIEKNPTLADIIYYARCNSLRFCKVHFSERSDPYPTTGFIAMSFDFNNPELVGIRDAIKGAIVATGYEPDIMSESQKNGFILPHMLNAIKQCRFLVLDATYENCSAYFEAGYAMALEKEIIICCKKSIYEEQGVPFDIAQWNLVLWSDLKELEKLLTERIN